MTKPRLPRAAEADPAPPPSGATDLEQSLGYLLNRAANMIAARFNDDLRPHDVNLQLWRVMAALSHESRQSLTDLADHTGAELSYLSRSVASGESRGLLVRSPSPSDKRTVLLSLTPPGRALVRKLLPRRNGIEAISLSGVSPKDIQTTLATLRVIYTNLVDAPTDSMDFNRKLTVAKRVRKRAADGGEQSPSTLA